MLVCSKFRWNYVFRYLSPGFLALSPGLSINQLYSMFNQLLVTEFESYSEVYS